MTRSVPSPGISRHRRLSDEGLQRLSAQLEAGTKVSQPVLAQWIRRYGDAAKTVINKHGLLSTELNAINHIPDKKT